MMRMPNLNVVLSTVIPGQNNSDCTVLWYSKPCNDFLLLISILYVVTDHYNMYPTGHEEVVLFCFSDVKTGYSSTDCGKYLVFKQPVLELKDSTYTSFRFLWSFHVLVTNIAT